MYADWLPIWHSPFGSPPHTRRQRQRDDLARPAGFEPATRCLEVTVTASGDVACCRSTSCLAAGTIAGCRRASREVCLRWLPDWLPEFCSLSLISNRRKSRRVSVTWACRLRAEASTQ